MAVLNNIVALTEEFGAMIFVDDSDATGFIGKTGRGTHEHFDVMGILDIITTTFGKTLGGASGGGVRRVARSLSICSGRGGARVFFPIRSRR